MSKFKEGTKVEIPKHKTLLFSQHPNKPDQVIMVDEYSFVNTEQAQYHFQGKKKLYPEEKEARQKLQQTFKELDDQAYQEMEDLFKQETDARFRDRIGRDHQARVNLQKRREKLKLLDESRRYAQWELSMRRGAQIGKQEHDTRMLRNDKAKLPYNSILIRIYEFRDDKPFPVLTQSLDNFLFFGPTKNCQNLVFFPIEDFSKSILFVDIDFLEFKPLNDFSAIDLMSENDVFKYFESFSL